MTIQRSNTSLPYVHTHSLQRLNAYGIKPVTPSDSKLVHHYQDVKPPRKTHAQQREETLLQQLLTERDKARKTFQNPSKELAQQIIQVIKQYNALAEILVKVEAKEGFQVDQALQHFLVFHKPAFQSYGISIRQFLYLEYDPIALRQRITHEGTAKTQAFLLGGKGIFTDLFYLFDKLVSALDHESFSDTSGQTLDIKA